MYHGNANERQGGATIYMVKEEGEMEKRQLTTKPEPVTSRSLANPLAAEPWSLLQLSW